MSTDRLMVGVSGVRGTIGSALTPRVACDFGCAFGTMLGPGATVVIGRDSRTSGPMLRNHNVASTQPESTLEPNLWE